MFNSRLFRRALTFLLPVLAFGLSRSAPAQSPDTKTPLPQAKNLPALELSTLALKSGNRYQNCPNVTKVNEAACNDNEVIFDAPTGPDALISQAARRVDMSAFGPGVSLGNIGGWRVNKVDVEMFTSARSRHHAGP